MVTYTLVSFIDFVSCINFQVRMNIPDNPNLYNDFSVLTVLSQSLTIALQPFTIFDSSFTAFYSTFVFSSNVKYKLRK